MREIGTGKMKEHTDCYLVGEQDKGIEVFATDNIDYIDEDYRNTTLSLMDYYTFYGFVNGIYSIEYENQMEQFIEKYYLMEDKHTPIKELELFKQLLVRMFISNNKNASILILHDFEGSILECEIYEALEKLKLQCVEDKRVCMIVRK